MTELSKQIKIEGGESYLGSIGLVELIPFNGLYANAHRGKVRKASISPLVLRMAEEELKPVPSKGLAAMIRKVYEIDPMLCPKCGGQMKVIAFITDYQAVDRIIEHLKLRFVAEKPPPRTSASDAP